MRSFSWLFLVIALTFSLLPQQAVADKSDAIYEIANEAVKAHEAGNLDRAFALYSQVIDSGILGPGERVLTYCYNNRATIWLARGNEDMAFLDLSKGIEYNPDHTAYFNRGAMFEQRGRIDEAISDYDKAIKILPTYGKALEARGHILISRGQTSQGRKDLQKAQIARLKIQFF